MFATPIDPERDPPNKEQTQLSLETNASHVPATSGSTLLPRPVASLVSLLTQSTSLSLRVGTFFGGVALDGARATTLTGLELGRAVIEGILTRAGRDVTFRSGDEHGRREAESLLERSVCDLEDYLIILMCEILNISIVGAPAYDRDLGIILCCGFFPFLVHDAGLGCQLFAGSFVNSRCHPRIYRVVESYRGHHHAHPTRISRR